MQEFKIWDKVLVRGQIVDTDNSIESYRVACGGKELWVNKYFLMPSKTHDDGLIDAWEVCRRIMGNELKNGFSLEEIKKIFGEIYVADIICSISAQDAIDKIKAWEEAREIHVNDVVRRENGGLIGVVSYVAKTSCCVTWISGVSETTDKSSLTKTGRTADIAGLLAEIGGD